MSVSLRHSDDNVCGNGVVAHACHAEIFSAFLTIADPTPPTVGTPAGEGWTAETWSQGTLPLSLASSDITGISATRVYADGSLIATLQRSCSYIRPRPCTDEPAGAVGLPTAGLADGAHQIEVGAADAAGNETRVQRAPLLVDNNAPAAPVGLGSPAPTSTTTASRPLVAAGGHRHADRRRAVPDLPGGRVRRGAGRAVADRVDGLALPAEGEATLRVWLVDALGHEAPGPRRPSR